jgi:urea transport system permease protein
MTNFKTIFGYDINDGATQKFFYFLSAALLIGTYLLCRWFVQGRAGKILVAIRDGENRVRFTGYNPVAYKTFVYAFSAGLAGLAGALFVLQVGLITPTEMDIAHSVQMVLWVALGGRGTLVGAVLGTLMVNFGGNALSESYPAIWSLLMGAAFLAVILFMPRGVMGLIHDAPIWIKQKLQGRNASTRKKDLPGEVSGDVAENPAV